MRAALLSIGSELLHGFLTDTNAMFLTQELTALGIEVVGVQQVDDNLERIVRAFRRALDDAELVVASGGIGPTEDDLTREAVAEVCGEQVTVDPALLESIRRFFASRGIVMPEQNAKQAWVIPSSETLDNPMGTAPGWFVRKGGQIVVLMPGVPREMYRMWREQAVPRIVPRLAGSRILSRTLKTIGIGESAAERAILDIVHRGYPTVATYAKDDGVHIRITAIAPDESAAERAVSDTEREVRERIGRYVYGYLDDSLADVIVRPLRERDTQIAIWEAGSAGRLANLFYDDDVASTAVKVARLTSFEAAAAEHGTGEDVEQLALACASSIRDLAGTAFGASLVVRVSPGNSPDRFRGDVALALAHPGGSATRRHDVSANPPEIRRRAMMWHLDFLWTAIRDATGYRPD